MEKHGSDKGYTVDKPTSFHNYTLYYNSLFAPRRYEKLRLFELGIGTTNCDIACNMGKDGTAGASLRAWREYFPQVNIFAADIDKTILVEEDRIKTYYCDQMSKESIYDMWTQNTELWEGFDIIIDDALHTFDANKLFFENSVHKLNVNGVFIIEDVGSFHLANYKDQIKIWENKYPNLDFRLLDYIELNHKTNIYDNELIVVKRLY